MTRILTTIKPHKEKSMQTTGFGTQFSTISANTAVYDFHLCTLNWYSNHSIVWSQKLANPRQHKCVMHRQHSLCSERQGKKAARKSNFHQTLFFRQKRRERFSFKVQSASDAKQAVAVFPNSTSKSFSHWQSFFSFIRSLLSFFMSFGFVGSIYDAVDIHQTHVCNAKHSNDFKWV